MLFKDGESTMFLPIPHHYIHCFLRHDYNFKHSLSFHQQRKCPQIQFFKGVKLQQIPLVYKVCVFYPMSVSNQCHLGQRVTSNAMVTPDR